MSFAFFGIQTASADSTCKLNLLWGHGGAAKVKKAIKKRNIKGENLFQGCGVFNNGDNKYQLNQIGFNGDWMSYLSPTNNGGLIPIMSYEANRHYYKYNTFGLDDREKMSEYKSIYSKHERQKIDDLSELYGVRSREIIDGLNAVGFIRMTHYHWASLVKRADDLISQKSCQQVEINFICHNDEPETRGGALDDRIYNRRMNRSKFSHIQNLDPTLLSDAEGSPIVYHEKKCVHDMDGNTIYSIPRKCNESHVIDKEVLDSYKSGSCGSFLYKVSTKYKEDMQLFDKADMFRKEDLNLGYDKYRDYPVHPDAIVQ